MRAPASRFSPTCVPHLQAGAPDRREPVPEQHKYQQNKLAPSGSPSLPLEDSPKTPSLAHSTDRYDPLTSPPPTRDTVFSPPRYLLSIALPLTPPATWHVSVWDMAKQRVLPCQMHLRGSKAGQYGLFLAVSTLLRSCTNPTPRPSPRGKFSRRPNIGRPASFDENTVGRRSFHSLRASRGVHRLTQGVGGPGPGRAIWNCSKCRAPHRVLRGARPQPSLRRVALRGIDSGWSNETDCN